MTGHEDPSSALLRGALPAQTADLAVLVHLVVLKHRKLNLLSLVLVLLGSSVRLLLSFLGTTTKPQHKVKS